LIGNRKKNAKNKIGKGDWSYETQYLSITSVMLEKKQGVVTKSTSMKKKKQKSVGQRIASMSDQSKRCLKQCVVTFIAFCVTFF